MNLFHRYPHIYWQTACLTVNASANEENDDNKSTNYGKIAAAIGEMLSQGVKIALPDINSARFGFAPDAINDQIIFGLKGLVGIGDDIVRQIIDNRPYASLEDFFQKNASSVPLTALVTLVKAGCFDTLTSASRTDIMHQMLALLANEKIEPKASLDFKNLSAVSSLEGFIPDRFNFAKRVIAFRSYIFKPANQISSKPKSFVLDTTARIFFENELANRFFREDQDYYYNGDDLIVIHSKFEKVYKTIIEEFVAWLKSPETVKAFNERQQQQFIADKWEQYCQGSVPKWEMDSLSFYYTEHELAHVNTAQYDINQFSAIPVDPIVIAAQKRLDKKTGLETAWDKYQLYRIAGTVLDRDNNKHTITLLTTDGVVTVKLYAGAYAHYNKQISTLDPDGTKKVLEKSWFTRGTKLLVTGIRRGDSFWPKKYSDSVYHHTICRITDVMVNGDLQLQVERIDADEN